MTPQIKLVSAGAVAAAVAKFAYGKDWQAAMLAGLVTVAAIAILTAKPDNAS